METALRDGASRPASDGFVFFGTRVDVKKNGQPETTTHHHGATAFKHPVDEARSQSFAKTPKLEHISQLEVFAHWIPEALQADAEDVVKSSTEARSERQRQQDANEKTQ